MTTSVREVIMAFLQGHPEAMKIGVGRCATDVGLYKDWCRQREPVEKCDAGGAFY
jgi:Ni,Fe-hydrogenase III small subunit